MFCNLQIAIDLFLMHILVEGLDLCYQNHHPKSNRDVSHVERHVEKDKVWLLGWKTVGL